MKQTVQKVKQPGGGETQGQGKFIKNTDFYKFKTRISIRTKALALAESKCVNVCIT